MVIKLDGLKKLTKRLENIKISFWQGCYYKAVGGVIQRKLPEHDIVRVFIMNRLQMPSMISESRDSAHRTDESC